MGKPVFSRLNGRENSNYTAFLGNFSFWGANLLKLNFHVLSEIHKNKSLHVLSQIQKINRFLSLSKYG